MTIGIALPYNNQLTCVKAGMEHASAVNGDSVKYTWWLCEKDKSGKR
jgi:hypothetical protein